MILLKLTVDQADTLADALLYLQQRATLPPARMQTVDRLERVIRAAAGRSAADGKDWLIYAERESSPDQSHKCPREAFGGR